MKALANFPSGWTDAGACARNALAASRSVVLVLRRLHGRQDGRALSSV